MGHAACSAFKRGCVAQRTQTLHSSDQSHVLSAAWTQWQLGRSKFTFMMTGSPRIHARLQWPAPEFKLNFGNDITLTAGRGGQYHR
jgi:hypothetical protein